MKKIGIYTETTREAIEFIRTELNDTEINSIDLNKKYVLLNPIDRTGYSLEKMRGCEFNKIYFASKRIEEIYDFFTYTKSRIR